MTNFSKNLATMAAFSALTTLALSTGASADNVILDDLIVDGSACIGLDCVNGENFGFDTLRLKENNLRIHFDDTSATASFPSNDWRLVANDSGNGGANKFSIEDSTAGRNPFTVEAGAPANTLYVEADGDVGVKTANPVVDIHIVEGNTPTLRLEQDGSDGFTPQTYDIAANEANFFIRDVTNGSKLAFRMKPGAPEDSLFVAADGKVGIGSDSPAAKFDVFESGNQETVNMTLRNSSSTWVLQNFQDNFRITKSGTGIGEFTSKSNGNMAIGGTCVEFLTAQAGVFQCTFAAGAAPACALGACP